MPKRCVAAGCDGGNAAGLSLHKFPKNPVTRDQWSKEVAKTQSYWTEPSEHSRLCSLHFTKDSYETSVLLAQEMGLPSKKRSAKFGSYSIIDLHQNKVIDVQLVQVCM